MTTDQPPPEAVLIRRAREARNLTPAEAAVKAKTRLGDRRWRQIEDGSEGKGKPLRATDKTLAHMAAAVLVSPEQLVEVDRIEAAEILREILRVEAQARPAQVEVERVYPDFVGDDEFFRHIWDFDRVPESERQLAIHSVTVSRSMASGGSYAQSERRNA